MGLIVLGASGCNPAPDVRTITKRSLRSLSQSAVTVPSPTPTPTPTTKSAPIPFPSSTVSPLPTATPQSSAQQAFSIFLNKCSQCHGPNSPGLGNFKSILDRNALIALEMVKPGNPEQSKLFSRIADGTMPTGAALSLPERETIRTWILGGALPFDSVAPPPANVTRQPVSSEQVISTIAADLAKFSATDALNMRYFTLGHLNNQTNVSTGIYESHILGIAKTVNSLSWMPTIVNPVAVDAQKTVFRVDLRKIGWTRQVWNEIIATYPYAVFEKTETYQRNLASAVAAAGNTLPFVRGDWFVDAVTSPTLYHRILGLPDHVEALEFMLNVNVKTNIANGIALRAGFKHSNVSVNNRVIERHPTAHGSYWRSYDFASSLGKQNIFQSPLGPVALTGQDPTLAFEPAGGEIIFNLPNGMQAYYILDHDGKRLDSAPTAVVRDPLRADGTVTNASSCLTCHANGMNVHVDEIRDYSTNYSTEVATAVKSLYKSPTNLNDAFITDVKRFNNAQALMGLSTSDPEPIAMVFKQNSEGVDIARAAAELGISLDQLLTRLNSIDLAMLPLDLRLLVLEKGNRIDRKVFSAHFQTLVNVAGLSSVVPTK